MHSRIGESRVATLLVSVVLSILCTWPAAFAQVKKKRALKRMTGEAAIVSLGNRVSTMSRGSRLSGEQLKKQFRGGRLFIDDGSSPRPFYMEDAPLSAPGSGASGTVTADAPLYPLSETFSLHSRPGAKRVIYLDFRERIIDNVKWNELFSVDEITGASLPIYLTPLDVDGNPLSFSDAELIIIQHAWRRVAQDFAPFDVDVTTAAPPIGDLERTLSDPIDDYYGITVAIGDPILPNGSKMCARCSGLAFLETFGDYVPQSRRFMPEAIVFPTVLYDHAPWLGDVISHEAGHALGLVHKGTTAGAEYFTGHGDGTINWAPLMGSTFSFARVVTQWSKGEYPLANNTQDELATMRAYGLTERPDDHGNSRESATRLDISDIVSSGIIGTGGDVDLFSLNVPDPGRLSLEATQQARDGNVDVGLEILNSDGSLLVTSKPRESLNASITLKVPAGTYYVRVSGSDFLPYFTSYGSLGDFFLVGSFTKFLPPEVALSASPQSGIAPLTVSFLSSSTDQDGTIVSNSWFFGDGESSSAASPSHTYRSPGVYTARVTATDDDGLFSSADVTITVSEPPNQAPIVAATASLTRGDAPLSVTFNASAFDGDGSISGYSWDFGDGGASSESSAQHTYQLPGTYTARVTVTDEDGASGSDSVTIVVNEAPNVMPVVDASAAVTGGNAPLAVSFGANATDEDGTIEGYVWDLGDGSSSTARTLEHTYQAPGTYTAMVTARDNDGGTATASITVQVSQPNRPPVVTVLASATSGQEPLTVTLTGDAQDPDEDSIVSYSWDFGDGALGAGESVTHTYSAPGTYTARLTASDGELSGSNTAQITVNSRPDETGTVPTGEFSLASSFDLQPYEFPLVIAADDVNGDGNKDVVIGCSFGESPVWVLKGNGDLTFSTPDRYLNHPGPGSGAYPQSLTIADFDGNNSKDILTGSGTLHIASIYRGNGDGTFQARETRQFVNGWMYYRDVDQDGDIDVVDRTNPYEVALFPNDGTGSVAAPMTVSLPGRNLAFGDVDGDGDGDLLSNDWGPYLHIARNNGNGTFTALPAYPTSVWYTNLKSADFNKDGRDDVVTDTGGYIAVLISNGDGTFQPEVTYPSGARVATADNAVQIADLNADGWPDIGHVTVDGYFNSFLNKGDGTFFPRTSYQVPTLDPAGAAFVDLDADGALDVVIIGSHPAARVTVLQGKTRERP